MGSISLTAREDYVQPMFAAYFGRLYYKQHEKEINSTSPYAVTDKLPTLRVVDNPITTGSGHTEAISSTNHYGLLGGYKGSSIHGGGGNWSLDTTIQFDHINMCPVTGREFTDAELKKYHDDWLYQVSQHGKREAEQMTRQEDLDTGKVIFNYYDNKFKFSYEDLESLQMQARFGDGLVEFIDNHAEESHHEQ